MKLLRWVIVILVIAALAFVVANTSRKGERASVDDAMTESKGKAKQDIREAVTAFGERLKDVSLLSPGVSADIEREYSPYVTRSLLASWTAHPEQAMGRHTSSPWPERIEPVEIIATENGSFVVRAILVLMTSEALAKGTDAGTQHLELSVLEEDGTWKIDSVKAGRTAAPGAPREESDKPQLE